MIAFLIKALGPTLLKLGLGFLLPDHKSDAARLKEQQDIMEKADAKAEERRKARVEVDRDVGDLSVGVSRKRLRQVWSRD